MPLEALPHADKPTKARPKSSPAKKVAVHLVNQLRRPTRLRRRAILSIFALIGIVFLIIGRRHAVSHRIYPKYGKLQTNAVFQDDLQRTASNLGGYIPSSITDAISHYGEIEQVEHNRWDDAIDPNNGSNSHVKKPKFHLLIPTPDTNATVNLCKTLSSAAILNYPPPAHLSPLWGSRENFYQTRGGYCQEYIQLFARKGGA
jgi:hypothetical protein